MLNSCSIKLTGIFIRNYQEKTFALYGIRIAGLVLAINK
jgi:hypothetical protein